MSAPPPQAYYNYPQPGPPPHGYDSNHPQYYPQGQYPQGPPQPQQMYYQQAPPPQKGDSGPGCLTGCLAALCCCCALDALF